MDAATLIPIATWPDGLQSRTFHEFPTVQACQAQAEKLLAAHRMHHPSFSLTHECLRHYRIAPALKED